MALREKCYYIFLSSMSVYEKKTVCLNGNVTVRYYEKEDSIENAKRENAHRIRVSTKRSVLEKSVFTTPKTELERVKRMITSWRKHDTCIVFGNLGRQPYLLNYYLDLCFGHQEDLQVYCSWPIDTPYRVETTNQPSDFLFIVEPLFGSTIKKPSLTKHLVVLTSHLNLDVVATYKTYYCYHLSSYKNQIAATPDLISNTKFKPPIFHEKIVVPDGPVILNVSESDSANEAYLRLLTGKELIRHRPFKILMTERDRVNLKTYFSQTKRMLATLKFKKWNDTFYFDI